MHHSVWDVIKFYCTSKTVRGELLDLIDCIRFKVSGVYNEKTNDIHIFTFNFDDPYSIDKPHIIHTLYHEIRHYYQHQLKSKKYMDSINDNEPFEYLGKQIERDANSFSARMSNKHKEKISKILNIYTDWINPFNTYHD